MHGRLPPPHCLKANRVPVGLLSLVAVLVPIIPIVSLCPFHIFHGLNSGDNAAHRPGLCVTQYLLLANVRSATAFKTSDAINELSCIDSCRFLKTSPCCSSSEPALWSSAVWVLYLPILCHWLGCVTSRKHLESETRQTFKQRLRIAAENLKFCGRGVRAKRAFID